jgi:hypothetical protein
MNFWSAPVRTTPLLRDWHHDAGQSVIGDFDMLNPCFAITFHAARLGFEAQNAVAFHLMRVIGDASKTEAGDMAHASPARSPSR